jgi:hypothetical protein
MGTDIHAFVEYADESSRRSFSGMPEDPAWLFARCSLTRDYDLFDALGDGRNSQMAPEDVGERALFPPRGVPADLSLESSWEYYDLIVESQHPDSRFWPKHGVVTGTEAAERVQRGTSHLGTVVQSIHYGRTAPRGWQVVSKEYWHTPSWLLLREIQQSLEHHRLSLAQLRWDFRAVLRCMSEIEAQIGRGQVRLVFWFDN